MATRFGTTTGGRWETEGGGKARSWAAPLALGILMAVLGAVAISSATMAGLVAVIVIGAALGIAGFVEIFSSLGRGNQRVAPLRLMGGILSVVVGGLFVVRPATALSALTLLLAGYFLASGLFHGVTALAERHPNWGWDLMYGLSAIALGVIAVSNLRTSSTWFVGTLVGVEILLRGVTLAAVSLSMRRVMRAASHTPA